MKKLLNILLISSLFLHSCYKEEMLTPSEAGSTGRFEFPQGKNDFDEAANNVYIKFGTKIIYKGFRDVDFNLSWTKPAIGKVGYDIPQEQQKDAVLFMVDHIFGNLSPKITSKIIPPYFYVADSISESTAIAFYEFLTAYNYQYDGLDFWAFSWNGARPYTKNNNAGTISYQAQITRPQTPYSIFYRRGVMLKDVFKRAVSNGNIIPPEGFSSGFDFTTAVDYRVGTENNPNYYKKRGFPGQMTNVNNFDISALSYVTRTGPVQIFTDYIHLCMRYQQDSIEILYPKAKYPLIHQKYPIVVDYMKQKYDIDLNKIARKPLN